MDVPLWGQVPREAGEILSETSIFSVKWEVRSSAEGERGPRKGGGLRGVEKFTVITGESELTGKHSGVARAALAC